MLYVQKGSPVHSKRWETPYSFGRNPLVTFFRCSWVSISPTLSILSITIPIVLCLRQNPSYVVCLPLLYFVPIFWIMFFSITTQVHIDLSYEPQSYFLILIHVYQSHNWVQNYLGLQNMTLILSCCSALININSLYFQSCRGYSVILGFLSINIRDELSRKSH